MKLFAKFLSFLVILVLFSPLMPAKAAPTVLAWVPGLMESAQIKAVLIAKQELHEEKTEGILFQLGACEVGSNICTQADFDASQGVTNHFTDDVATLKLKLTYDGANQFKAQFTKPNKDAGVELIYTASTAPGPINYLQLSLRENTGEDKSEGSDDEKKVIPSFKNGKLNGSPLTELSGNKDLYDWNLNNIDLTTGFVLEGELVITRSSINDGELDEPVGRLALLVGFVDPEVSSAPGSLIPSTNLFCTGETASVEINFPAISDLYGYQFEVTYDPTVSATAEFVNNFFDTSDPAVKAWNAVCASGKCQFGVSHVAPQLPVSGQGGTVARLTLTGVQAGITTLHISNLRLADRNGKRIEILAIPDIALTICGYASASGFVSLQGRDTPIDEGTITLASTDFGTDTINFDPNTGAWSLDKIKVMPGGTNYTIEAAHSLYLAAVTQTQLKPSDIYRAPDVTLKGGDADNSEKIDIADLACIAGTAFGGPAATCGQNGSTDINADGLTDILDLVLAGGNYDLAFPQPWS